MSLAPRALCVALLCSSLFAVAPGAASAQTASISVDQDCIEQGNPITGGGLVSGSFSGAPTGVASEIAVSADEDAGEDWSHYGADYADTADADGDGTFSFNIGYYTALPDTLWISGRYWNWEVREWLLFVETEVPVCDSDPDTDGDGVRDSVDNCRLASNPGQENNDLDAQGDACDADDDNDGVSDSVDNCQFASNPSQENNDLDAHGDACDADDDNDGVNDGGDNCQFTANSGQRDDDQDGIGDACDGTFDSSDGKSSGGGWLATSDGKVNFSSSAKRIDGVTAGNCTVTVGQTKIKCLTVDGYYQSPTNDRAVFVGSAMQDGVATRYRIELNDNGEPGTSDRIEITTDGGFAAAGVIGGGNLQVHRGL